MISKFAMLALIRTSISSADSSSSFDIERERTYSITAQCVDYAVDWQMPITIPSSGSSTVIIAAHPLIDDLFSLSGIGEVEITANGTLWSSIIEVNGTTAVRAAVTGGMSIVPLNQFYQSQTNQQFSI